MTVTPEERARKKIDHQLEECGWGVQNRDEMNIYALRGVAVREFAMPGVGEADYLLYADGKAIGVVEAKPADWTLKGVEPQSRDYQQGLPREVPAFRRPLPFSYETTGTVTQFTNALEPEARSREVFAFYRPEELVRLVGRKTQVREALRMMPPESRRGTGMPLVSRFAQLGVPVLGTYEDGIDTTLIPPGTQYDAT